MLVGSTAGRFGEAGHADYAAAKAAIQGGLLLSLKNEAARLGPRVRVNAVAPGWTVSPMTRACSRTDDVRRITRTMPLRKVAVPEDVAAQVVVLASERLSGHVTGELVTIAGGMEGRVLHDRRLGEARAWMKPAGARVSCRWRDSSNGRELTAINSMAAEWRSGRRSAAPLLFPKRPTGG